MPRKKTPLTAIKQKCLECSGGDKQEVQHCELPECPLFPYRLGIDPNAPLDLPGGPAPEAASGTRESAPLPGHAAAPDHASEKDDGDKKGQNAPRHKKPKAVDQLTLF